MSRLLRAEFAEEDKPVFVISAATRSGLEPLVYYLAQRLAEMPLPPPFDDGIVRITPDTMQGPPDGPPLGGTYDAANQVYVVSGAGIERLIAMTQLHERGRRQPLAADTGKDRHCQQTAHTRREAKATPCGSARPSSTSSMKTPWTMSKAKKSRRSCVTEE